MTVQDAQRDVRTVFIGGFWGQHVSAALWLVSAALGTWLTPRAAILEIVFGGCFMFPTDSFAASFIRRVHVTDQG